MARKPYSLKDTDENPTEAIVDDVILTRGGEPQGLDADQVKRLKETGVKLEPVDGEPELKGKALDDAVKAAELDLPSDATADDKRAALAAHTEQTAEGAGS